MGYYMQQRLGQIGPIPIAAIPPASSFFSNLLNSLFGKDWTKIRDTQKVEEFNRMLAPISALATYTLSGQPDCNFANQMSVPCPNGPALSPAQASQLIAAVTQANQQVMASYERQESRQNATHTIVVPDILSRLQRIAAGERWSGFTTAPGGTTPGGGITQAIEQAVGGDVSKMLPWLMAGIGAVMLLRSS